MEIFFYVETEPSIHLYQNDGWYELYHLPCAYGKHILSTSHVSNVYALEQAMSDVFDVYWFRRLSFPS